MTEHNLQLGQRVQLVGKDVRGSIAYIGQTNFAAGQWVGVVLDETKGRNNGTVRGVCYFKCASNCGLFVRPSQLLILLDEQHAQNDTSISIDADVSELKPESELEAIVATGVASNHCPRTTTTKIVAPKQARSILSSSSQLALNMVSSSSSSKDATPVLMLPPKRSKTSVSPSESFCCVKQASFVETGFLEILQPHFTPGQALRSPTDQLAVEEQQTAKQRALSMKVIVLTEEVERLKRHRTDNKRLVLELEQLKLQNEQLAEFKVKIMEQQGLLQRELQRMHQQVCDAHAAEQQFRRQLNELHETAELLTLDKEMAEERAETMQLELELLQERNEELTLDVEILRAENVNSLAAQPQDTKSSMSSPTVGELRKLEQHNQRLKETVVRLRDALTQEKLQLQKALKELDTQHSEVAELQQTKQTLSRRVDLLEAHIIELKEQVDAALGAETMVATLAACKIELEDRVKLLEEEVNELEALEQIHEQLIESNQELELDLREELATLQASVSSLQLEKNEALTRLYDRDVTIVKFRDLVKTLNEQLQQPTTSSMSDDLSSNSHVAEALEAAQHFRSLQDFNQLFFVSKAYERALDVQLNAIALKISQLHVNWLLAYLPDDFMQRGGAHDALLALLTLQRLVDKHDVIAQAINEKFPSCCDFGKAAIYEGFSVHRFAFRCKCLYFLRALKLVLQQLICALNAGEYELCAHAAIYRAEIEAHEQPIDELLRQLKAELLDENSSTSGVERALGFFSTLLLNLLAGSDGSSSSLNAHQLYSLQLEVLELGLDGIYTAAGLLHTIIQLGDEQTESFGAMSYLMQHIETFRLPLKKLQHSLGKPNFGGDCSEVTREQLTRLQRTNELMGKLLNVLVTSSREATRSIFNTQPIEHDSDHANISITHAQLWKILTCNQLKLCPEQQAHQTTISDMFRQGIQLISVQLDQLAAYVKCDETARQTNHNTLFVRGAANALLQRAAQTKQYYADMKLLRQSVEERDKEIKTLKYVAKMKQNDYSELQLRKELAERNLAKSLREQQQAAADTLMRTITLQHVLQQQQLAVFTAVGVLDERLNGLERSWHSWQQQHACKSLTQHRNADVTLRETQALQSCLRRERKLRVDTQMHDLKEKLRNLTPIYVPRSDQKLHMLEQQLLALRREWLLAQMTLAPRQRHGHIQLLRTQCQTLITNILVAYFTAHPHRRVSTHFGQFATIEFCKELRN